MIIMSKFNTQDLCSGCKSIEENHPMYAAADEAEFQAVKNGVKNYPGVGLPAELREQFIKATMEEMDEFFGNVNWNRFDGGYEITEADNDGCKFCKEPIPGMCLNLHDVDEFYNACLRCGLEILKGFCRVAQSYADGVAEDQKKIESLLAEDK